ncbi:MAG: hypothetical protein CRN43_08875 [Candidatus Nephrothrix sp. EaCA]|nr:MAG: hypothetical protein CRN43_08875 [Candidatus Nephrothrix sp. EaCA]
MKNKYRIIIHAKKKSSLPYNKRKAETLKKQMLLILGAFSLFEIRNCASPFSQEPLPIKKGWAGGMLFPKISAMRH